MDPTAYLLIVWLVGGEQAYDDTLSGPQCHLAAEALKEGGLIEVEGLGRVQVVTASCIESADEGDRRFGRGSEEPGSILRGRDFGSDLAMAMQWSHLWTSTRH